jgi:hypothetical protein
MHASDDRRMIDDDDAAKEAALQSQHVDDEVGVIYYM